MKSGCSISASVPAKLDDCVTMLLLLMAMAAEQKLFAVAGTSAVCRAASGWYAGRVLAALCCQTCAGSACTACLKTREVWLSPCRSCSLRCRARCCTMLSIGAVPTWAIAVCEPRLALHRRAPRGIPRSLTEEQQPGLPRHLPCGSVKILAL